MSSARSDGLFGHQRPVAVGRLTGVTGFVPSAEFSHNTGARRFRREFLGIVPLIVTKISLSALCNFLRYSLMSSDTAIVFWPQFVRYFRPPPS